MININQVIKRVPEWSGKNIEYQMVDYGLTNRNYMVSVNGKKYFVRIPGEKTEIFINREVELHNTISASEVGIGARVYRFFKPEYVIITEFIDGELMSSNAFKDKNRIIKAIKSIRQIHMNARFISNFVMFDKFSDYLQIVKDGKMVLPTSFSSAEKMVYIIHTIFTSGCHDLVSCHNDLLAENFIEQDERMRIIDWELSGLNDPCFDLGDFSVEQGFGYEEDKIIIEAYYGHFDELKFCWLSIYKSLADILWTLWAVIQSNISDLEFDFWNYGLGRYNRAMNTIESKNFSLWLKEIKHETGKI